jgi:toxin-antitoxin system PIN domain toxin
VILADVNVLIYAFRADVPQHRLCRAWLESVILGRSRFAVSPLSLAAVVRITTNPRTFPTPSTLAEAFAFGDNLLSQPHCEVVEPGERHWSIFQRLCMETQTTSRRVTDAWYAALAIEHGCEWITLDRDFARFPGLKWSAPTAPA